MSGLLAESTSDEKFWVLVAIGGVVLLLLFGQGLAKAAGAFGQTSLRAGGLLLVVLIAVAVWRQLDGGPDAAESMRGFGVQGARLLEALRDLLRALFAGGGVP